MIVLTCVFSQIFWNMEILRLFWKKGTRECKENYRPEGILPVASEILEKLLCKQINLFLDQFLSKCQCGFRKRFSTQDCLLAMMEKLKRTVDNGNNFEVLLTDLSKALDCFSHELIIAKLNAFGFSLPALKVFQSYFSNWLQQTKVNDSYSSWSKILFGVPQGSILSHILFNIFLGS